MIIRLFNYMVLLFTGFVLLQCQKDSMEQNFSPNNPGKGGSMARIAITGDYLYAVDDESLKVFDIKNLHDPVYVKNVSIGFGIETIFPYGDFLYIGSQTGMYIYSISNPALPTLTGVIDHIYSCDPVVVNDSLAFVTLRSGGSCRTGMTTNELEIINIENKSNPFLETSKPLTEPYGLSVDSNYIFVCQGKSGLSIFQYSNNLNITEIGKISTLDAYDVIAEEKVLLVIGPTGFYQFDYSNISDIQLLSSILIGQ